MCSYSSEKKKEVVRYAWKTNPYIFPAERKTEKLNHFVCCKGDLKHEELPEKKPQKPTVSENQMQAQTSENNYLNNYLSVNLTLLLLETNSKHKKPPEH